MADNNQNSGGQSFDQNDKNAKKAENPAKRQKSAYKHKRFVHAKRVKEDYAKQDTKQKIKEFKPVNDANGKTQNIKQDNVNRNSRHFSRGKKNTQGDGRGGVVGRLVNPQNSKSGVAESESDAKKPLNPFLVDFDKGRPQQPKRPEQPQQPRRPEEQKRPEQPQQPRRPQQQKPKKEEAKNEEKNTVSPIPPINPFIVSPSVKSEKISEVKKEDLEPADQGDADLDNEIIKKPEGVALPKVEPAGVPHKAEPAVASPKAEPAGAPHKAEPAGAPHKAEPAGVPHKAEPAVASPKAEPAVNPSKAEVVTTSSKVESAVPKKEEKFVNPFAPPPSKSLKNEEVVAAEVVEKPKESIDKPIEKESSIEGGKVKESSAQSVTAEASEETFSEFLNNVGITKKRISYFCSGVIVFVVLLLMGVFILNVIGGHEKVPRDGDQNQEEALIGADYGAVSSYLLGVQFSKNANINNYSNYTGAVLSLTLGGVSPVGGLYADYMSILRQMQNIYDTNLYHLIDKSVDRRESIDEHLAQMKSLIDVGEAMYYEVVDRMQKLDNQYATLFLEQTQYEKAFFEAVKNLTSQDATNYMNAFVDVSQKMVQVKAYYGAYKSFKAMFANSVNAMRPRYDDIMLNKEAIIKGVYVFDVPGSDIGAIIRLDANLSLSQ